MNEIHFSISVIDATKRMIERMRKEEEREKGEEGRGVRKGDERMKRERAGRNRVGRSPTVASPTSLILSECSVLSVCLSSDCTLTRLRIAETD